MGVSSEAEGNLTQDEILADQMMEKVTSYDRVAKQFTTELLFKTDPSVLHHNFDRARAVAVSAHRRYVKMGEKALNQVQAAYAEKIDLGFAERLEGKEKERREGTYFMPTSCIFKNSTSYACRPVFNASSKSKSGYSLNCILYKGRDLSSNLLHILIRYRLSFIYTSADIGRFYWKVKLRDSRSTDRLRYVFVDRQGDLQHCRSLTACFGVSSSGYQAQWCTKYLGAEFEPTYPKAVKAVQNSQYIDDIGFGSDAVDDAADTASQLRNLLLEGNFDSHKYCSSNPEVLLKGNIPPEKCVAEDEAGFLGLVWKHKTDEVVFDFRDTIPKNTTKHTPRSLLSEGSRLFDPLGYFASLTIRLRRLMRRCVEEKLSWDDRLEGPLLRDWLEYREEVRTMTPFSIPRPALGQGESFFLAAMSDASVDAYASCIYAVSPSRVTLILAKSKICPLKGKNASDIRLTVPRLELLSLWLSTKLIDIVKAALGDENVVTHYFTDSAITKARCLRGPSPYKVWVAARVRHILTRTSPEFIHGLCGLQNSADAPSRGKSLDDIRTDGRWWGRDIHFLRLPREKWPQHRSFTPDQVKEMEMLDQLELAKIAKPATVAAIKCLDSPFFSLTERVSKFLRIIRIAAYAFRFILKKCKNSLSPLHRIFKGAALETGCLKISELRVSARFFHRLAQRRTYADQLTFVEGKLEVLENSDLKRLGAYLDEQHLLRVKTRLDLSESIPFQTRCPILLPRPSKNSLSMKIVLYYHELNGHAGQSTTLYLLRRTFFVIGSLKEVAFSIHRCHNRACVKLVRPSVEISPLPDVRTNVDFVPWFSWGIDYIGEMKILATDKQLSDRCYGIVYSCMTTRAVWAEVVTEMTTESFLLSFRKVIGIKGCPRFVQTDCARTFQCADRQLTRLFRKFNQKQIEEETNKKGVIWNFSLSRNAASNGSCESMVKIFKAALFKIFRATSRTTLETMASLFAEASAIASSRPLCPPTSLDVMPVSPALLCQNRELGSLPLDAENVNRECRFSKQELYRKQLVNSFWRAFKRDFILKQRVGNYQKEVDYLKEGQIVILAEKNASKGVFNIAKVTRLHRSKDGRIRRCDLLTPHNTAISRHVNDLLLFEDDVIRLRGQQNRP